MDSFVFSYYITETNVEIKGLDCKLSFGKYTMFTDSKTPSLHANCGDSECVVFGYAINVFTKESDNLARDIISCCSNISEVIEYERMLGGKYIILFRIKEQYYFIGDATCSIPIFYTVNDDFACSSNMQYLANHFDYIPNKAFQKIRDRGDISQAMPFDITQYSNIKQLLPNHYFSIHDRRALRYTNSIQGQPILKIDEATRIVKPLIETICDFYHTKFKLDCPITSGRDSRVVLAFLASLDNDIHCYTIRHPEHKDDSQDIVVPMKLCAVNHISYEQILDSLVTDDLKCEMDQLLGENNYSLRTLQIAQTIHEHFGNDAVINGDIIGQVGKCSLHRDIPLCFATPGYYRCKLHNYSKEAKKQLSLWLEEIKNSGECVNTFDLFSIENRMGRWAAQENLIYNSIGQLYLNVFNSRSIIYVWTAVSRKERKKSNIHIDLIKETKPELLGIPFESDENVLVRLSKVNGLMYLLSSYIKYHIERMKFMWRKQK